MIYNLCNLYKDINLDTFYQLHIIEASALPEFSHLTTKSTILSILSSLDDNHQVLQIPFLPEKFNINHPTKTNDNTSYNTKINFPLLPQDEALKEVLDSYQNKTVIALIDRNTHSHLYGTQLHPLIFSFEELHANNPTGLKGYTLDIEGTTPGNAIYFSEAEINESPIVQGLALDLASSI